MRDLVRDDEGELAGELERTRVVVEATLDELRGAPEPQRLEWPAAEAELRGRVAALLARLRTAVALPAPTPATLPASLRERFVTDSGRFIAYVYPTESIFDPESVAVFNTASLTLDAGAVGFPILFERMSNRITSGFGEALALAAMLVVAIL